MLLVLVVVAGTVSSGGARLSFDLGPIKLQPAEFAKATVLLALAAYLAEERSDEVSYPRFLGGLIMVGVPSALIIIQPDLGSSSVLVAMAMGVLLVAGAKPKYIALITLMSIVTVDRGRRQRHRQPLPAAADRGVLQPGRLRPAARATSCTSPATRSGRSPPAA